MPECQAGRQGGHPGGGRRAAAEAPEGLLRGRQLLTAGGTGLGTAQAPPGAARRSPSLYLSPQSFILEDGLLLY